jgi:hypothetical protein
MHSYLRSQSNTTSSQVCRAFAERLHSYRARRLSKQVQACGRNPAQTRKTQANYGSVCLAKLTDDNATTYQTTTQREQLHFALAMTRWDAVL